MKLEGILVGGGLQSALIALAVLRRHPTARLALVEQSLALGGNHTWSFHAKDLDAEMTEIVSPLVEHTWPGYEVAFPGRSRVFVGAYSTLTSSALHRVVTERFAEAPNARLYLGASASSVEPGLVALANGRVLEGDQVVDARGPQASQEGREGFQKFVGLELELSQAPVRRLPCLMDARVDQHDGFRFVYTLPLTSRRWLVEDTYYSDTASLDVPLLRHRVLEYASDQGACVERVVRMEQGVLPLPLRWGSVASTGGPLLGGYRGGWFHPTTGYSLPCAARLASAVAQAWPLRLAAAPLQQLVGQQDRQARFGVLLNRLLFRACPPSERWRVMERFYSLPQPTVERFYALQTTLADRARILLGRPPRGVSPTKALFELFKGDRVTG